MKTILGFPDYKITKDGRVWSKPRIDALGHNLKGLWIKPAINSGYFRVVLCKNSKTYNRLIHRLVLETYIGLCPDGMECRHLNGNRTDNRLENLCWGTRSENRFDAIKHGTHVDNRGEKQGRVKLTDIKVRVIRYLHKVAKFSQVDLAWQFDVDQSTIHSIICRKTWRHI